MSTLQESFTRRFSTLVPQPVPEQGRAEVASGTETQRVTARLDIVAADLCPYCGEKMKPSMSSGVPVYYCETDRHAAPRPNGE